MTEDNKEPEQKKRIYSLDILRGYTMFWITGGWAIVMALAAIFPSPFMDVVKKQISHAPRGLFYHHDIIFPMFLFLAGASWPFSLAARRARGESNLRLVLDILRRFAILALLGSILFNLLGFDLAKVRFNSILGRIGFGWAVAALGTLFFKKKGYAVFALVWFLAYWAVQYFVPMIVEPGSDPWGSGSFQKIFDLWVGGYRPNGKVWECYQQAFGCVSSAQLGVLAGEILRRADLSGNARALRLAVWSVALGIGGYGVWLTGCTCFKQLWSPLYILTAGSISFAALSLVYWIADVKGYVRWGFVFRVIGMNAVTIYVLQWAWGFRTFSTKVFGGVASLLPELWGAFVISLGAFVLKWLVLYFLYRKKIFLRV